MTFRPIVWYKDGMVEIGMKEPKDQEFDPRRYVGHVRRLYHMGGEFRGRRTKEQQEVAALLTLEADELFESVKALCGHLTGIAPAKQIDRCDIWHWSGFTAFLGCT